MTETQSAAPPLPLSYVAPTDQALAPTAENAHLLQHAAEYYAGTRLLRTSGGWDIVWGAIALLAGLAMFLMPIPIPNIRLIMIAVAVVGGILLATGIWLIAAPSPLAMLVDGVTLVLLSLVNLGWWLNDVIHARSGNAGPTPGFAGTSSTSHSPSWFWLLLFASSLLAGIGRFRRYKRFKAAAQTAPSKATLQWLNAMRRHLKRASTRTAPTFLRFEGRAGATPMDVRVQLLPDLAVCLINRSRLSFVPEPELTIEPVAPIPPGKKGKAQLRMQGRQFNGFIRADSLARYIAWKDAQEAEAQVQDET